MPAELCWHKQSLCGAQLSGPRHPFSPGSSAAPERDLQNKLRCSRFKLEQPPFVCLLFSCVQALSHGLHVSVISLTQVKCRGFDQRGDLLQGGVPECSTLVQCCRSFSHLGLSGYIPTLRGTEAQHQHL